MASSANFLCFLLCLSLSSLHIHARENHFFSKFYPYTTSTATATNDNNNNVEETEIPPKQENQPTFTPEAHNGHGLYGNNMDQETLLPSSNIPEEKPEQVYNTNSNSEYVFNNGVPHNTNKNKNEYGAMYQDNAYVNNNNNNKYQYPTQQQGMSDTRFLENGKYFYDLNNEEMYKNQYQSAPRRTYGYGSSFGPGLNSRNQYNYQSGDDNLYKFNNFMEDEQEKQEEYVP